MPVVIIPLVSTLLIGFLMIVVIGKPIASVQSGLEDWLGGLSGANAVVLGIIVGLMMAFDMGGPVNKVAYTFGLASLASGNTEVMAAVMAAGMTPPLAMALATVDEDGLPDLRMVLLKDVDPSGFAFYTNLDSAKGRELAANPKAALLFHWKSLRRQVRVRGAAERVTDAEADAYFATRARPSQLGAWASDQSRALDNRETFERRFDEVKQRFEGGDVPRPSHWGGYRVVPDRIEFWTDRPHRLHERRLFVREDDGWSEGLLYP